ncbi:MAG TPA: tetratricopeptide repeat protein [Actinocrinis sp.]|nr:tetratricopeptide repeat protein [Actinocrinis sp.]
MDDKDLLEQGWAAWDAQDWPTAARIYEDLATRRPEDPRTPGLWYDAALAHKFLRDWPRAFELGRQAARLAEPGTGDPAFWNLGIAATVLHSWSVARDAWIGYGISQIRPGQEEIEVDLGPVCVRLGEPDGPGEVVWARRICPTRARVVSIPMAVAGRRFGDIVLHDGEPTGRRTVGELTVPVFDELLVWRASEMPTWQVQVTAPEDGDYQALMDLFSMQDFGAEPQSSMDVMCKCCSEGTVDYSGPHETSGAQIMWLAAPREKAEQLLESWRAFDAERRTVGPLEVVH